MACRLPCPVASGLLWRVVVICSESLVLHPGAGYHMVIVKEEGCNVDKITNTIQKFIPDISYDQNIGTALTDWVTKIL